MKKELKKKKNLIYDNLKKLFKKNNINYFIDYKYYILLLEKLIFNLNIIFILPKFINYLIIKSCNVYMYITIFNLNNVVKFINNFCLSRMKYLIDLTAVDNISEDQRFKFIYLFFSEIYKIRFAVVITCNMFQKISTISYLFKSARWLEREVWDMYGIEIFNNNDLRRISTDYNFKSYPLRKEFPLSGYFEINYDHHYRRIVYKKIELMQELRFYQVNSDWEEWDIN